LSDNFGRSFTYFLDAVTAIVTVSVAGGPLFILAASILGVVYYNGELTGRYAPFMLVNCLLYSGEGKEHMLYSKSVETISAQVYGQTSRDMRRLGTTSVLSNG
jgi:hypothetical protein